MRWGGHRAGGFPARYLLFVVLLLAAAMGLAGPSRAVELVDVVLPDQLGQLGLRSDRDAVGVLLPRHRGAT